MEIAEEERWEVVTRLKNTPELAGMDRLILATGAHERPMVFGNNDLPGVMLAGAVSSE